MVSSRKVNVSCRYSRTVVVGVAQIADRDVLAEMQVEVAAAGRQHERAGNRGSPDDLVVDQPLDVLDHRIAVIAGLAQRGIGVGAQHHRVRTVDAGEPQLAERLRDSVGIARARRPGSVITGLLVPWRMPSMPAAA